MPRIRTIKPELPQDVKLASASRDARYTFVLLISQADDDGLVAGAHRQLLGLLYPHDEDVTSAMLLTWVEELIAVGVLRWRATTDGAPIIEITNWAKHQRVDNKGRSSFSGILTPYDPAADSQPRNAASDSDLPPSAATRGISPRLAAVRRLEGEGDLGVGPRSVALTRPAAKVPKDTPPWVRPLAARWKLAVGGVKAGAIQRELAEPVEQHGEAKIGAAIDAYAKAKRAGGKAMKLQWFVEDVVTWVLRADEANQPIVDAFGSLTPYGERITRPDKVPA